MSKESNFDKIHAKLTSEVEIYIKSIIEKYGKFVPKEKLTQLQNINNYENIIKIYDFGSINGKANNYMISMPLCADKVLRSMSRIPGFGINKKHVTYNEANLIINNNTFIDYVKHVFISGTTTESYFEDLLLHETMHFCGSGGANALKEGINELLTRKLALEKGFKTSGCGYPKEVAIAYELQNIFGEDIINQIAFINNDIHITAYLEATLGKEESNLYLSVTSVMNDEFQKKYYQYIDSYNGIKGLFKKVENYNKINYEKIYNLINEYKTSKMCYSENNKRI